MPKTKISEFSATAGNNTDIDGINISEGCPPSGINDAIRELMAQLKDFQAGTAGDSFNGPIGATTPAAGTFTNLSASGTFALTGDQVQISEGGTGQTTANAAFNALAPSQTSQAGKYLKTDGTNTSWDALDISTADITGTLPIANGGTGLTALGTGVQTALGIAVGSAGAFVVNGGALGTPSSGTVTNLTGTASININGTVGATTPTTGAFTTLSASGNITVSGGTANGVAYLNGSKVLTTGSALTFDATNGFVTTGGASVRGTSGPSTGVGLEITYGAVASTARLLSYDRDAAARKDIQLDGLNLLFNANGSEQMRLTSTGLGIGTSSPTNVSNYKSLSISGSSGSLADMFVGSTLYGRFQTDATYGLLITSDPNNAVASSKIVFDVDGTERARITSGGDLLINTTTSSGLVTVARGASGVGIGVSHSGDDGASAAIRVSYTASTGTAYQFDCYFNGGRVGYISSTSTATAYNTSSDYRLKDNPQPLTGSGAFIDALQPKTWNWTADGSRGVGFIAHEVQEVSPGSVVGTKDAVDEEGKPIMQAMEYGSAEFIANIIAELQSLRARVAQLEGASA